MKINTINMANIVTETFNKCILGKNEGSSNFVEVCGIVNNYRFHALKLEKQRETIVALIAELPLEFKEGWSFLEFCKNKNAELWTDDQLVCEYLMVMAIGLDLMSYCLPKEMWFCFPGGVPYIKIKEESSNIQTLTKDKLVEIIAINLKKIRKQNKFTQVEVSNLTGIQRSLYSKYETGQACITILNLVKLAKTFNVRVDEMLEGLDCFM